MLDFNAPEFLIVAVVALFVIGPKELPRAMRVVGYWVAKARGAMSQFRSGFDAMVREAELSELEKQWKAENERIMREHPPETMLPAPPAPAADAAAAPPADAAESAPAMVATPVIHDDPVIAAAGAAPADKPTA